jgi:signal transduction histidine kinase
MLSTIKERIFWWIVVPVLAAVLAVLAVLQYRWSNEISAATRSQMQANLQNSLIGFRADLTRELGAACVELRSVADDSGSAAPAQFVRHFRHWQETAAHPALVSGLYLWRGSDHQSLLRLAPGRDEMEPATWPEDWSALRQRLEDMALVTRGPGIMLHHRRASHLGTRSDRPIHRSPDMFLPWFVDQSIPALVYPLRRRPATPDDNRERRAEVTWIIVQLDSSVLRREIFPELAQRYFRGPEGLDYRVAVLDAASESPLYSSDSRFGEAGDSTRDAALNLFGPPFRRSPSGAPAAGNEIFGIFRGPAGSHTLQSDDTHTLALDRLVRFEPLLYGAGDGIWQIVVQHQRGSLEAAVGSLRRRHLMLSFGVLILLALTMALVVLASQRARRLAALQMNFVAGVSHELRTPLAVISSAAENISHGVVADQTQLARYGASILKHARQLTRLVEQVLVFAAAQQRAGNYLLSAVSVGEVIDAALESTSAMATAAGITVERRVEPGLPPVAADFAALSQCLQNLITNAIKYGGDGRWLGIRADANRENGVIREIEITVSDRGLGIAPAELKHIFEPFYRSPSVAGSNVHGTGLGLPLARAVIEAMRGRLTVNSEPGRGSAFTIHLGVATVSQLPEKQAAAERLPGETAGYYS